MTPPIFRDALKIDGVCRAGIFYTYKAFGCWSKSSNVGDRSGPPEDLKTLPKPWESIPGGPQIAELHSVEAY